MNPPNPDIRTFFESQPLERAQVVLQKAEQPGGELLQYVLSTIFEILVHTRSRALNIFPKPSESGVVTDYRTLVREDIRSMLEGFSGMRYFGGDLCEGIEFLFPGPSHSEAKPLMRPEGATLRPSHSEAKPASARREREASGSAGAELKKLMRPEGATLRPSRLPVGVFFQKCSLDPMFNGEPGVKELWMQGGHVLLMPITGASVASTKKAPLNGEQWAYMAIPRNEEARVSLQGGQECAAFTISRISH